MWRLKFLVTKNQLAALAIAGLVITAVVVGAVVFFTLRIRGGGRLKLLNLKAYADPETTQEISAIDWGTIPAGGTSQTLLYLKSMSTVTCKLSMSTENWDPPGLAQYMSVTWTYDETLVAPFEVRAIEFTLHVSEDVISDEYFSFDLVIIAAG